MLCCGRCQTRSLCVKTSWNILCTGNSLPENAPLAPQLHNNENVHVTTRGYHTYRFTDLWQPRDLPDAQPTVSKHSGVHTHTHTHTHTFNGPFSKTTQVSWYQKGKPIWILLKRETVSGSGVSLAICKSAPCSRRTTMPAPHHSVFTGRMPFLLPNQQRQSTEGMLQLITVKAWP